MFFPKRFFSLFVAVLFAALVLAGCDNGTTNNESESDSFTGTGTWSSTYSDSYTITSNHLTYDDGYGGGYSGTIRYVKYFTSNSGVIIFEYDADGKPTYQDYDENWQPVGDPYGPPGNFIATYFKALTASTGDFATAFSSGGAEAASLAAAKTKFTLDAVDNFVGQFGGYAKQ